MFSIEKHTLIRNLGGQTIYSKKDKRTYISMWTFCLLSNKRLFLLGLDLNESGSNLALAIGLG